MKGVGGKPFYDRKLAGDLRTKALEELLLVVNDDPKADKFSDFKKDILLKLAGNVLPRLNEHSGPDQKPIPIMNVLHTDNSDEEDTEAE